MAACGVERRQVLGRVRDVPDEERFNGEFLVASVHATVGLPDVN